MPLEALGSRKLVEGLFLTRTVLCSGYLSSGSPRLASASLFRTDHRKRPVLAKLVCGPIYICEENGAGPICEENGAGPRLKKLDLRTHPLSQTGNGLTFDKATIAVIQQLASAYGVEDTPGETENLHDSQAPENK